MALGIGTQACSSYDVHPSQITDTNVWLLAVTVLASALHLLFEFLAFKSDISFWKAVSEKLGVLRIVFLA